MVAIWKATMGLNFAFAVAVSPVHAAYVLAVGDTVELSVSGFPDLHTKSMIDVDGVAHFPLISSVKAAGITLEVLQADVKTRLHQKAIRQRGADGHEQILVVDLDEVTVQMADYRPIYIRGDVSKPGEQSFRPGLSVRQAIALAGGYDIMRFRMGNPFLDSSDLRAEYETLWIEMARQQARAAMIKSSIDGKPAPDLANIIKAPVPPSVLADIARVELQQSKADDDDNARQRNYLLKAASTAQTQIESFAKPRAEAQQSETDEALYKQRLGDLLDKGVIARDKVAGQQRSLLESTQRFLNYSQRISELESTRDLMNRQVEHLDDEHRSKLLRELQDANVSIATTRAKLQSVSEKLLYTGAVQSQLVRGSGSRPGISIHHSDDTGGPANVPGNEDTVLMAGDTVEVSLKAELTPENLSN